MSAYLNLPPGCTINDIPGFRPEDDYDECEHEHADFDIVMGELSCICGYRRPLSVDEIECEVRRIAEYDDYIRREERHRFWRDLTLPVRKLLSRVLGRNLPTPLFSNDDIPF